MNCNTSNRICNKSTLLKTGLALGVGLVLAYAALPGFRVWIAGIAPLLLSLLCPLSMLFCMRHGLKQADQPKESQGAASSHAPQRDA